MAGKKGKSGRKSWDKEAQSKELWDLSIPVLKRILSSKSKALELRRVDIALELVKKMAPNQVQHSGSVSLEEIVAGEGGDGD